MAMLEEDDCEHHHLFRDECTTGSCRDCEYVGPIFIMRFANCDFIKCRWCSQDWYKNGGDDACKVGTLFKVPRPAVYEGGLKMQEEGFVVSRKRLRNLFKLARRKS